MCGQRPIFKNLILILFFSLTSLQAKAVLLTFDEAGVINGNSAETFYAADGVTFSGGGLLAEGPAGGNPGQPVFTGGVIGTLGRVQGDSFFDIWVHFDGGGVSAVSGDYVQNLGFGGRVEAYDLGGTLLDTTFLAALLTPPTTSVETLGRFSFTSSAIAKLHLISDNQNAASYLDNLEFSPVPIPAAFWLFGTALAGFIGFSKRRKAA